MSIIDGKLVVYSATPTKLLDILSDESYTEGDIYFLILVERNSRKIATDETKEFMDIFLLTYDLFISSLELLDYLIKK
jgi:hypothetical protein